MTSELINRCRVCGAKNININDSDNMICPNCVTGWIFQNYNKEQEKGYDGSTSAK